MLGDRSPQQLGSGHVGTLSSLTTQRQIPGRTTMVRVEFIRLTASTGTKSRASDSKIVRLRSHRRTPRRLLRAHEWPLSELTSSDPGAPRMPWAIVVVTTQTRSRFNAVCFIGSWPHGPDLSADLAGLQRSFHESELRWTHHSRATADRLHPLRGSTVQIP